MHLAITNCPDALIRVMVSSLPEEEVTLGALPPGDPLVDESAGVAPGFDAVLTASCPGSGGCSHVGWLCGRYPDLPILVVTGTEDPDVVVAAFEAGADVVLKGPIDPEELLVRLRSLGRQAPRQEEVLRYGRLRLNRLRHTVEGPCGSVHLTPREYQILQHLLDRAEKVVSRTGLGRAVWWSEEKPPSGNLLDVHVFHLRSKLEWSRSVPGASFTRSAGSDSSSGRPKSPRRGSAPPDRRPFACDPDGRRPSPRGQRRYAGLLVGADGAASRVRRAVAPRFQVELAPTRVSSVPGAGPTGSFSRIGAEDFALLDDAARLADPATGEAVRNAPCSAGIDERGEERRQIPYFSRR